LLSRYDPHERQASPAMPFLFQRKIGTNQEAISPATVVNMPRRRCEELAEAIQGFTRPVSLHTISGDCSRRSL
jgi:hypothetical protein